MGGEKVPLQEKIANFLLAYRNSAHATTGQSPATLFMGRSLRSRLDILKPDLCRHVQTKLCKQNLKWSVLRTLQVGQNVLARDYRQSYQKWQPGKILSKTGPLTLYKLVPIWFGAGTLISFWMQQRHRLILHKTSQYSDEYALMTPEASSTATDVTGPETAQSLPQNAERETLSWACS